MIKFDSNNILDWYYDSNDIAKVYYNGNIVYQKVIPGVKDRYFTLIPLSDNTRFVLTNTSNYYQYSLNGGKSWTIITGGTLTPSVNVGDKIMLKGEMNIDSTNGIGTFSGSSQFNVEGNIMSLLYGDNFGGQTSLSGKSNAFKQLFYNSSVVDASDLILPATELASDCYGNMFASCTSLTVAPQLPATTLASSCYNGMFYNCTSLTVAPQLPATTLAYNCYNYMFEMCINLTEAPILSAETLVTDCYHFMFKSCYHLNSITCLATDISANGCTSNWLYGVSTSGTFTKAASMQSWTSGYNGIPTNWTIREI